MDVFGCCIIQSNSIGRGIDFWLELSDTLPKLYQVLGLQIWERLLLGNIRVGTKIDKSRSREQAI